MAFEPFLTIDDEPITITRAVRYLQAARKFDGFIGEILRQFVLERQLQERASDLDISSATIEQAIIDFRLERQLTDAQAFQDWLTSNGLNYDAFHDQVSYGFRMRKLRDLITEQRLQEYFIERKIFLDRVVLSRIIVDNKELAEELKTQIAEGTTSFEHLARDYSLTDDRIVNGMVGPVSRGTMPDVLRAVIDTAKAGDVVGPVGLEERWGLFRVEEFLYATLDDPQLRNSLQDELFEQWLVEKMQVLPIQLKLDDPSPTA
jgi:parvulin-like peptidyl-prolyl isomerase